MSKLTITEALAEIKTIKARIEKKRQNAMRYFARDSRMKDPLAEEGGSTEFVKRERQGIADLEERLVTIRSSIQAANLATALTIGTRTRPLADWLNWRRDVSDGAKGFLAAMTNGIVKVRQEAQKNGLQVADKESGEVPQIIVSVSERDLAGEVEAMETLLGELDGRLSLLNATTFIEV